MPHDGLPKRLRAVPENVVTNPSAPEFVTPMEAAALLGVTTRTVSRWVDEGRIERAYVTLGGHRRYRRKDIEEAARKEGREVRGAGA